MINGPRAKGPNHRFAFHRPASSSNEPAGTAVAVVQTARMIKARTIRERLPIISFSPPRTLLRAQCRQRVHARGPQGGPETAHDGGHQTARRGGKDRERICGTHADEERSHASRG